MRKRRLSAFGIVLCVLYLIPTALCLWIAQEAGSDDKGRFVMLQMPLTPQLALLDAIGADSWLRGLSWLTSYLVLVPPFLVVLYLLGSLVQAWIERPSPFSR
ncbi:hypothetical protein [Xanthomonas floridensis]|uniref:Uncharacterized protein n=1 Tax=Xanthomonas floridensis TaxID=1843580 RepID=A0A1A9M5H2_9XANT|nr:hypothetical protein [Xanthomonas floridensis]MEA5124015.1 hypothetical protein [Xanthomonas floridensis]MEA5131701.1 hypothetical protein [Xanthomonas floridensis]OAG65488.1 hypothetical protein A7D17_08585 [Xanthomonas floridensis]